MFIHTLTLFEKVKSGGQTYYLPHIISSGFITRKSTVVQDERGVRIAGTGKCVVPIKSLSSIDRVPSEASQNPQSKYFGGRDKIMEGDYIASGAYSGESYTVKQIAVLPMCFNIQSIVKNDFSSIPCYVLSGV